MKKNEKEKVILKDEIYQCQIKNQKKVEKNELSIKYHRQESAERKKEKRVETEKKVNLETLQRLMRWKAQQQSKEMDEEDQTKMENERLNLQKEAKKKKEKREKELQNQYEKHKKKWEIQKKKIESEMKLKIKKRRDEKNRENKISIYRKDIRASNKFKFSILHSKKKVIVELDEIDSLDSFMKSLRDVQKKNDKKRKDKEKTEIFYNDETVYEEEDLIVEEEVPHVKNWATKKKELKPIDHLSREYEPFRKNFYREGPEISAMSEDEVKKYQNENLKGVKIYGSGCPRPIKKWTQCGLPEKIIKCLLKLGYKKPFPVQCQTIPAIMSGRDIIGVASTGSGKTATFILPMIRHIKDQRHLGPSEGPIAVVISPTRELSMQTYHATRPFAKACNIRIAAIYGGAPISEQIAALKRGTEIVICTPGRMIDLLCTNQGRVTNLKRSTYVVLDEADRMFDLGFEPQIMSILKQTRPDRQTLMFSATFPRPIEKLARQILNDPLEIIIGGRSIASEDVDQFVEIIEDESKFKRLLELLAKWYGRGNILIFTNQRESVDELFIDLQRVGYLSLVLHGGVDQYDRDNTIMDFKNKIKTIMIATSVCSRGLDIPDLKIVINYNSPHHYEDYVHRVGRTGRAGVKGCSYTFLTTKDLQYAPDILKAMIRAKQEKNVPEELREMAKKFKDQVRSGESFDFNYRGYQTKGFKFDETEAKKRDDIKSRQMTQFLDPDEIPDVIMSEFDKAKYKGKIAEQKLKQIEKEEKKEDSIQERIRKIQETLKKSKNKEQFKKIIKLENRKFKNKKKRIQAMRAKAMAEKLNQSEKVAKFSRDNIFSVRLDINDYAEKVRNMLGSMRVREMVKELVGGCVEIRRRGEHLIPGRKQKPGVDTLHLVVHGENKIAVNLAKKELCRILNEVSQQNVIYGGSGVGRFSVV